MAAHATTTPPWPIHRRRSAINTLELKPGPLIGRASRRLIAASRSLAECQSPRRLDPRGGIDRARRSTCTISSEDQGVRSGGAYSDGWVRSTVPPSSSSVGSAVARLPDISRIDFVLHDLLDDNRHLVHPPSVDQRTRPLVQRDHPLLDQGGQLEPAADLVDDVFFFEFFEHQRQTPGGCCCRIWASSSTARSRWSLTIWWS